MKKTFFFFAVAAIFATSVFAEDLAGSQDDLTDVITKAKAQEYVHALVKLKLEEINTRTAKVPNEEYSKVLRAQQAAINEELLKLALVPLQYQLRDLERTLDGDKKVMGANHPKVLYVQNSIAAVKANIERTKAVLEGEPSASPEPKK